MAYMRPGGCVQFGGQGSGIKAHAPQDALLGGCRREPLGFKVCLRFN